MGITAWLLFVEDLLVGDIAGVGDVGRLLPGAAAKAVSGQDPATLLAPAVGLVLLALYAVAAVGVGVPAGLRVTTPNRGDEHQARVWLPGAVPCASFTVREPEGWPIESD